MKAARLPSPCGVGDNVDWVNAPETDDDSDVDADTDAPDDEDANKPEPTPDVSPTDISEDEPAEAGPETEPSEPVTSTDRSDAPTVTMLEMPKTMEKAGDMVGWTDAHHLGLKLDPMHWPAMLRKKIDGAVTERNRDAANAVLDDAEATNPLGEPEDT